MKRILALLLALMLVLFGITSLAEDDDDFEDTSWIDEAIGYFQKNPKMAILGGKWALRIKHDDAEKWMHGAYLGMEGKSFAFVPAVNRAPMWFRRDLFDQYLHDIDFRFAPFQFDDDEICMRAWLCGLQVGWYDARFKSLSAGGMRIWNNEFSKEQMERNGKLLYQLYADKIEEVKSLVAASNS